MRGVVVIFLLVVCCVTLSTQKTFTRCGLFEELKRRNFNRSFLSQWVCLIESESGKDTSKVTNKADFSKSYGLFQINSKQWCKIGKKGGECMIKCEDLLNDDITDDAICAKLIEKKKGFQAWSGWQRSCYGRQLYDWSNC